MSLQPVCQIQVFKHLGRRPGQLGDGTELVEVEEEGTTTLELLLIGETRDEEGL